MTEPHDRPRARVSRTRAQRGLAGAIALLLGASTVAATGALAASSSVTNVTAQPTATGGAVARWTPSPDANRYAVTAYRVASNGRLSTIATTSCWACKDATLGGLSQGVKYALGVTPITALGQAIAPEVVSTPITLSQPTVPSPPVALMLTPAADGTLRASWAPNTTGFAPDRWGIQVLTQTASGWVQTAGGDLDLAITSTVIPALPGVWKMLVVAHNAVGWSTPAYSAQVLSTSSCSGADLCVNVGGAAATPTIAGWGVGFLHGAVAPDGSAVDPNEIKPLRVSSWRVGSPAESRAATAAGASSITMLLSDLWMRATGAGQGGPSTPPWSDLTAYGNWVTRTVRQAAAEGWSPTYWDVLNEPDDIATSGYLSSTQAPSATIANILATFETAWRAIRAADPNARIMGPSLSSLRLSPGFKPGLDLDTFVRYSEAHGLTWDAISWHEISRGFEWSLDAAPSQLGVDQHVAAVRALLAQHPSADPSGTLQINEYSSGSNHFVPGAAVGYLRTAEDQQVASQRSCWSSECFGMAGPSGLFSAPSGDPSAVWWATEKLGAMVGQPRLAATTSSAWQLDALASRDATSGAVQVLIGRHWGCRIDVNSWCDSRLSVPAAALRVQVSWPDGTVAHVVATRAPTTQAPVPSVAPMLDTRLVASGGVLVIDVGALPDGDAVLLTASAS